MTRRHRARHRAGGWFHADRGRPEQPPGRHAVAYLEQPRAVVAGQLNADGMYPHGQPFRVPHDRDILEALDSLNNDPHQRYTLAEVMPS